MRRLISFACEGETLVGTLDEAPGPMGLLIVSGGNEVRSGAHRGMARLAARLAGSGHPVFRFDRRGVGDSTGENRGYASSGPDFLAAADAFRKHAPALDRLVVLGNCDAAAVLARHADEVGAASAILTNPWLGPSENGDLPAAPAIRALYAARLRDPRSWTRLPDFGGLLKGLRAILIKSPEPELAALYARLTIPHTVVLADQDAAAQTYKAVVGGEYTLIRTASHSFADRPDEFEAAVLAALQRYSAA